MMIADVLLIILQGYLLLSSHMAYGFTVVAAPMSSSSSSSSRQLSSTDRGFAGTAKIARVGRRTTAWAGGICARTSTARRGKPYVVDENQELEDWELGQGEVGMPTVTLKIATDAKGAVDDRSQVLGRFTSEASLDAVHRLRADVDAVLVGVNTIVRDDPSLTVRRVPVADNFQQPIRVILDRNLRIPDDPDMPQVLSDGLRTILYFVMDEEGDAGMRAAEILFGVIGLPVVIQEVPTETPEKGCPLRLVLEDLYTRGVRHVLVEGGPETASRFLADELVDRAIIIVAPVEFKDPIPSNLGDDVLQNSGLTRVQDMQWGDDKVQFWARPGAEWPGEGLEKWP